MKNYEIEEIDDIEITGVSLARMLYADMQEIKALLRDLAAVLLPGN
jgi:hypothetical protein